MGTICGRAISAALVAIWVQDLSDIEHSLLVAALERVRKTWASGFLPTPGNVRALLVSAGNSAGKLEAEEAWKRGMAWLSRNYRHDLGGIVHNAARLDEKVFRSLQNAGDFEYLTSCPLDQLEWAKKRFLEQFNNFGNLERDGQFIGEGEAKRIMQGLRELPQLTESMQVTVE